MTYQIEDGRKYLAQWDTGQRLILDDPSITEVDFAKSRELAEPVKVETEDGLRVVRIPNVCLQQPRDLLASFIVADLEGRSSVVHQATIPVLRRPKPDDYVEQEDEVLRWMALDARITDLARRSVKTVNGCTPDENGNVQISGSGWTMTVTDDGNGNLIIS